MAVDAMGGRFGPPPAIAKTTCCSMGAATFGGQALGAVTRVACVRVLIDLLRI
jgi:hypothetical protein